MTRYQVRTPEEKTIQKLVDDLCLSMWNSVVPHLKSPATAEDQTRFQERTHFYMILYVKAYDLCGLSNLCTDSAVGISPDTPNPRTTDRIAHLVPGKDVEDFLDRLTYESLESIKHLSDAQHRKELFDSARAAASTVFSRYLFENRLCGVADLCAASKEVNAWEATRTDKEK